MKLVHAIIAFLALALSMISAADGCLTFTGSIQAWYNTLGPQTQPYHFFASLHHNGVQVCSFAGSYPPDEMYKLEIWLDCGEGRYGLFERNEDKTEMMYYYGDEFFHFSIAEHHWRYTAMQHWSMTGGSDGC